MRIVVGGLGIIGLVVVLVFLAALGLFAYDEVRLRLQERSETGPATDS